jgi:hypothetical protein
LHKKKGPRGNFTCANIDSNDNLILLCQGHHKLIDDYPEQYCVELVKKYKNDHERMVTNKLNSHNFSTNLAEFEKRILEIGFNWLKTLPDSDYSLKVETYNKLHSLIEWMESIDFVKNDYLKLLFEKLSNSIKDTLKVFEEHMLIKEDGYYFIDKFYKQVDYDNDSKSRDSLEKAFDQHIKDLIGLTIKVANNFNETSRFIREQFDNTFLSNRIIPDLYDKA